MTGDSEPILRRFGWCSHNDQYHSLCRRTMRSQFGVETKCSCPNHVDEETEE